MAEEQQPFVPVTQVSVTRNGILIGFNLVPGLSVNVALDKTTMESLIKKWNETIEEKPTKTAAKPKLIRDPRIDDTTHVFNLSKKER